MKKLVYVMSPYTHEDPMVRHNRFLIVQKYMARTAFTPGLIRFSPIVANHELAVKFNLKGDAKAWEEYNRVFFERSDEAELLTIDGWETSHGIQELELKWAEELGIPVTYVTPPAL